MAKNKKLGITDKELVNIKPITENQKRVVEGLELWQTSISIWCC